MARGQPSASQTFRLQAVSAVAVALLLAGCMAGPGSLPDGLEPTVDSRGCPRDNVVLHRELRVDDLGQPGLAPTAGQRFEVDVASVWPAEAPWSCVRSLRASIVWTNGLAGVTDFYVGLEVPAAGISAEGPDAQQLFIPGVHEESVSLRAPADAAKLGQGVVIVVFSKWAGVNHAPVDIQATLDLEV